METTSQVRSLAFTRTLQGQITLATGFALLTALGAMVQINIGPVPITLQVLFVLLSGLVLGSRLGALSQVEYLAVGFAGAPVFAGGKSGLIALLGPTGGYLAGFVVGAYLAGLVAESAARPGRIRFFVAGVLGTAAIYISGAIWLSTWLAIGRGTNWMAELASAWQFGVAPFIAVDTMKAVVASGVTVSGRALAGRITDLTRK
ncbi:MAG: biotin transporter BioY [Bacteroidetes bacterium]|nr:biotin transporter BioY [Bacteroidota bacterium]